MSRFNEQNTADIASIIVRECRGSRRELLPFTNEQSLLSALRRAEIAYRKERELCRDLTTTLQKQEKFALHFEAMFRAWKDLPALAKNDLAELADYFSAIDRFGDDEEVLAKRPNLSAQALARLVTGFDNTFSLMERPARESRRIRVVVRPGPKRYLKKDKVNKAPLRKFAYSFKLFWDKTMKASVGHDFNNTVPFSIATPILTAASKVLSDQYVPADIKSILRDLQSSKYNPEEFRQSDVLAIFRPQLAKAAGIRLP
jgi:hypothetical protein